ncbi:amino acid permease [Zalerion maritima]|uniref:Amino acid permease n=1 Tax=Zalerion maritima TaxID=339359 RepID=A0AAD5RT62_9PEZI|nr:amino acid permease [Zalerion maritima]
MTIRPQSQESRTPHMSVDIDHPDAEVEAIVEPKEDVQLRRSITSTQMILMALGTSIGAGLFFGTGEALASGGPGYTACSPIVCTMLALGEMAATYPVAGAFYDYAVRFVDPAWGFAMGWNYVMNWLIVLPFELTVISNQLAYWYPPNSVLHTSWCSVLIFGALLIPITIVSIKGSKWFAKTELILSIVKSTTLVIFVLTSIVIASNGVASDPRETVGSRYWKVPGAFSNGYKGFILVFRIAGMSYGGTEMLGLTAAECKEPKKMLPLASKITIGRIALLYLVPLTMLGFVLPSDHPGLSGGRFSPFVLASELAGLPVMANFFSAAILLAIFSMANAAAFASSRALQALCHKGMGPSWGVKVRNNGLPIGALAVSLAFSLLAFIGVSPDGHAIFDWLLSLSGVSNYCTWFTICLSHIRLRNALKQHSIPLDCLSWKSRLGVGGSWFAMAGCILCLVAQIVGSFLPLEGGPTVGRFFRDVLGVFVIGSFYGGYQIWHKLGNGTWVLPKPITYDLIDPHFQAPTEKDSTSCSSIKTNAV